MISVLHQRGNNKPALSHSVFLAVQICLTHRLSCWFQQIAVDSKFERTWISTFVQGVPGAIRNGCASAKKPLGRKGQLAV